MTPLYHFTHAANLPRILEEGALLANRHAHTKRNIGDRGIKDARKSSFVWCGPGGVIADYVPFYFAPKSPMMYRLNQEGKDGRGDGQRPLVYFVTSVERVRTSRCKFVFTDGNARDRETKFSDDVSLLDEYVDWDVMEGEFWNDTPEHPDRKRRRQAELLVHERLPLELVLTLGVYEAKVAKVLKHLLERAGCDIAIRIAPDWYYK